MEEEAKRSFMEQRQKERDRIQARRVRSSDLANRPQNMKLEEVFFLLPNLGHLNMAI